VSNSTVGSFATEDSLVEPLGAGASMSGLLMAKRGSRWKVEKKIQTTLPEPLGRVPKKPIAARRTPQPKPPFACYRSELFFGQHVDLG
jgi:hypothetical protein